MLEKSAWQYKIMKDICSVNQGFQIDIEKRDKHKRKNNKIYITIQHLNGVGDDEYINDKDHNDSVVCTPDDVLMTRTGNTGRVVTGVSGVFHNNFFRINFDRTKINKDYLVYYLNQKNIQKLILEKAGTSTIPDLNHGDFYSIPFNYPDDINEQSAIANSLNNIDKLIYSLQGLIDKKNRMFDSAKQKLLNGKYKNGEWRKVKIGDIGYFDGNGVDKKVNKNERKVRLLNYMDIMHNNFIYDNLSKHFVTASENKYNKCLVKAGDIFLTPSSETRKDIGISAVAFEDSNDLVYSYHIVRFRPTIDMDMKFRVYLFQNKKFLNQASKYCEGSGKRYVCSNKKFASFELEIPVDIQEQAEIGRILYNMESEIKSLECKLQKYKEIKNGMMDDLLTGKVRLSYE